MDIYMIQQKTEDQMKSGHRKLDYGTPTDDEEVMLPPHDRATEVPDFPDTAIRDRKLSLIHNEQTGCYKQSPCMGLAGRERPPVIEDRPPLEATGGVDGRKPDQAPLLSPGFTTEGGGRPAPEL